MADHVHPRRIEAQARRIVHQPVHGLAAACDDIGQAHFRRQRVADSGEVDAAVGEGRRQVSELVLGARAPVATVNEDDQRGEILIGGIDVDAFAFMGAVNKIQQARPRVAHLFTARDHPCLALVALGPNGGAGDGILGVERLLIVIAKYGGHGISDRFAEGRDGNRAPRPVQGSGLIKQRLKPRVPRRKLVGWKTIPITAVLRPPVMFMTGPFAASCGPYWCSTRSCSWSRPAPGSPRGRFRYRPMRWIFWVIRPATPYRCLSWPAGFAGAPARPC